MKILVEKEEMNLSKQVQKLEEDNKDIISLCGQIIATLKVNRARNTLSTIDDNHFDEMLNNWSDQLKKIGLEKEEK